MEEPNLMEGRKEFMEKLLVAKMPFGKYKGKLLIELPEYYLVWFHNQGFQKGELGDMLATMYEIKLNGLEYLLKPFKNK